MDGEIVWEYINPFGYSRSFFETTSGIIAGWGLSKAVFRAYRYMPDYPGLKGRDLNPENLDWMNRLYGAEAYEK